MKRLRKSVAAGLAAAAAGMLLTGCSAPLFPSDDAVQTVYGPPPAVVGYENAETPAEAPASPPETARL